MNILKAALACWVLLLCSSVAVGEEGKAAQPVAEGLGLMPGVNTASAPPASAPAKAVAPVAPRQAPVTPAPVQPQTGMAAPTLTFPPKPGAVQPQTQTAYPYGAYVQQPYAYAPSAGYGYPSAYNPYMTQRAMPYNQRPPLPPKKKEVKSWGDTRYIWPDFYTDTTNDMWDKMINGPYDMGYMPGGWRFPSFSSPDPVTVSDAVTNQFPPIMEEAGHFVHFTQ